MKEHERYSISNMDKSSEFSQEFDIRMSLTRSKSDIAFSICRICGDDHPCPKTQHVQKADVPLTIAHFQSESPAEYFPSLHIFKAL